MVRCVELGISEDVEASGIGRKTTEAAKSDSAAGGLSRQGLNGGTQRDQEDDGKASTGSA